MERKDIVNFLESFVKQQKSEVNYGTYRATTRSSLLNEGLSTRANSVWKQSQFIVAYWSNESESNTVSDYLKGWLELTRRIHNQYLILECPKGSWTVFDKDGNEIELDKLKDVPQKYIEPVEKSTNTVSISPSRQIIFYGAPGTGKSNKIKRQLENVPKENIFRTTFHPDSDYSTFVGAYKPTKGQRPLYGLNGGLTVRLKNDGKELSEETITYDFVPQAFLNAYMRAYRTKENVYLIIEEINRGNCAQIFGDLFQLLDRNKFGMSDYTIKADTDLKTFLELELGEDSDGIKDGELCLPSNLYIYATMNTSDQSLFPIDSAFKRRWDWEYEPIKYENTNWKIVISGEEYSWVSFQKKINKKILDATSSEDKMLGDYFVNPSDGVITEKVLLNKILFYLWNDVCKDGEGDIFKVKINNEDKDITFSDLFNGDTNKTLMNWLSFLGVDYSISEEETTYDENESSSLKYSFNGESIKKTDLAKVVFEEYVKAHPELSKDELMRNWDNLRNTANEKRNKTTTYAIKHLLTDADGFNQYVEQSKNKALAQKRWTKVAYSDQELYVWNNWGDKTEKSPGNIESFIKVVQDAWNINITTE